MSSNKFNIDYWSERWKEGATGWDIGSISTPIKEYIDQLKNNDLRILVPGAGSGYEVEYLNRKGFTRVYMLDISPLPLEAFRTRNPGFPVENLLCEDFFALEGEFDLILEQTFFSAISPEIRRDYVLKMHELLARDGRLAGLLWGVPMNQDSPPYGGSAEEYSELFKGHFKLKTLEVANNSIPPRSGRELFINFVKKELVQ